MRKNHIFKYFLSLILVCLFFSLSPTSHASDGYYQARSCTLTAKFLKYSCGFDVRDEYLEEIAICFNDTDYKECFNEARMEQREEFQECRDVLSARRDVCASVGEEPYDPPFGEDFTEHFVNPTEIDKSVSPNPYFPLVTGNTWVYESTSSDDGEDADDGDDSDEGDDGEYGDDEKELKTVTVTVTDQTKLIDGVTCLTVTNVVEEDEEIVETTENWYTQDIYGNVWSCGVIAKEFEIFDGDDPVIPELVDVDGSWKAGRDSAKAGILLPSVPEVGSVIRQNVAWGETEDLIEILATDATESAPAASCSNNCLQTFEFTPLDAEENENRYYLPGTGLIVKINLESGERSELVEFISN